MDSVIYPSNHLSQILPPYLHFFLCTLMGYNLDHIILIFKLLDVHVC